MKRIIYCCILSLFVASCALAKTWTLGRQANAYSGEQNWMTDENGWSVYLSDNSNTSMKTGTIGLMATTRTSSAIRSSGGNGTLAEKMGLFARAGAGLLPHPRHGIDGDVLHGH